MFYTDSERRIRIIEFIKDNNRTTKTKVIEHMKGMSSLVTTHRLIKDLIKEGIVDVQKDKPRKPRSRSRNHYLIINDKNEFNHINDELSKIENMINNFNQMFEKHAPISDYPTESYIQLRSKVYYPYIEASHIMFQIFLIYTKQRIHSENHRQILYTRIVELMLKVPHYRYDIKSIADSLNHYIYDLKYIRRIKSIRTYIEKENWITDLRWQIENFKKEYLSK